MYLRMQNEKKREGAKCNDKKDRSKCEARRYQRLFKMQNRDTQIVKGSYKRQFKMKKV